MKKSTLKMENAVRMQPSLSGVVEVGHAEPFWRRMSAAACWEGLCGVRFMKEVRASQRASWVWDSGWRLPGTKEEGGMKAVVWAGGGDCGDLGSVVVVGGFLRVFSFWRRILERV